MRSFDAQWMNRSAAVLLFFTGAALVAGNLWYTAARSTIPLAIDGRIAAREVRFEKHPGSDDVCLLTLADGRVLQVDAAVFAALDDGQSLHKRAWQHAIERDGQPLPLEWSADAQGMWPTMGVAVLALILLAGWQGILREAPRR